MHEDEPHHDARQQPTVFAFTAGSIPLCRLSFSRPPSPPERPRLKRYRPLTDVDGEESSGKTRKKKRRLRLYLITSRLSLPFAAPSTHIVDRGSSKIAIWAKQRALGRNELRKAAIMNHVRMRAIAAQEAKRNQMELVRKAFIRHQLSIPRIPYRQHLPLPPSPLGLSNYDALDAEDGLPDDETGQGEGCAIQCDFNILEPTEPVMEDYDSLDEVAPLPPKHRPPSPPCEKVLDQIREKERQREVSFVRLGDIGC